MWTIQKAPVVRTMRDCHVATSFRAYSHDTPRRSVSTYRDDVEEQKFRFSPILRDRTSSYIESLGKR